MVIELRHRESSGPNAKSIMLDDSSGMWIHSTDEVGSYTLRTQGCSVKEVFAVDAGQRAASDIRQNSNTSQTS